MRKHSLSVIISISAIILLMFSACGDGDSGDSGPDGDGAENSDGDIEDMPDGDSSTEGDYIEDGEESVDGDKAGDGDSENAADGDESETEDEEQTEDSESDDDSENAETDNDPDPSGIEGYLLAILHNLNTGDFTGHEISLLRLSETGEWSEEAELITVHEFPRAATFTPNGNRLIVSHDGGWISIFDIRDGEATLAYDLETDGYYEQIEALDYNRVLLMDGNHIINGGGLAVLDIKAEPPLLVSGILPFSAPSGFAIHPGEARAAIFGVTPMDSEDEKYTDDMALADISDFPELIKNFDLWGDTSENVNPMSNWPGFSPDGNMLAGGNDAIWGNEIGVIKLFSYENGEIEFLDNEEVETPSSYVFSDNDKFLYVGSVESNRIDIFNVAGGTLEFVGSKDDLDLVDQIIPIRHGPLAGHLLAGPYDGPVLLEVQEDGTLEEISRFALDIDNNYMIGGMAVGHEYE